jgi:dTMP kinase
MKPRQYSGFFIVLEGTEGCGKSTLAKGLEKTLSKMGYPVLLTREPGGTVVAERLRTVILESAPSSLAELLAYEAARADHVAQRILPGLKSGKIVICDRFTASTIAYQGYARKLPLKSIATLNQIATDGLSADLTLWLDLPVKEGLSRAKDPNRFERESLQFHQRVRKGFAAEYKKRPSKWLRINVAALDEAEVLKAALKALEPRLKRIKK